MSVFKLSAQLAGHSNDVKAVRYKSKDVIISASRDNSVRIWRKSSAPNTPPAFDSATLAQSGSYVNSLALIPPSANYPEGLVVTSGIDPVIYVHEPKPLDQQGTGFPILLPGHANNVCSLDVSPNGQYIISGSWDTKAKIWDVSKWDLAAELDGHDKSVTAVLALKDSAAITGGADNLIRAYGLARAGSAETLQAGKTIATGEPVRALCRLPSGHASGAEFASAGNDFVIRLWTLRGQQIAELHGHESYVYSLACLPSGEIVSAAEDRTVRVWKGHECVQTIVHPAVSVWTVDVCPETGDIITGASDDMIRIWTRSPDRIADELTLKHFEEAIKGMAIPKETMGGDLKNQEFPGPEFLQNNTGKKDGHVQVIKNPDGGLEAHIWSSAQNKWEFYGAVVDSPGSSDKKIHHGGKEWDFVFQVDIEDGKPTLPLPYNAGENPYDGARRFLEANELPIGYLEQVAAFIVRESKGQNIENLGAASADSASKSTPAAGPKHSLPVQEYVLIPTLNSEPLLKKINSLNADLIKSGEKEFAMNPAQISSLQSFVGSLQTSLQSVAGKVSCTKRVEVQNPAFKITPQDMETVMSMATNWQYATRLPALDLLRCLAVFEPAVTYSPRSHPSYLDAILSAAFEPPPGAPVNEASAFMSMRAVANSFATAQGRAVAISVFPRVVSILEATLGIESEPFKGPVGLENRNLNIAISAVMHNYAVLASAQQGSLPSEGLSLLVNCIGEVLQNKSDPTALTRALSALGTLAQVNGLSGTVRELGGQGWARSAGQRSQDSGVREWADSVVQALG